jgi:hypothetical protein
VHHEVDTDGDGPACRHVYDADADADVLFVIEITAMSSIILLLYKHLATILVCLPSNDLATLLHPLIQGPCITPYSGLKARGSPNRTNPFGT